MATLAPLTPLQPAVAPQRTLLLPFSRRPGTVQSRTIPRTGLVLGRGQAVFGEPLDDPSMSVRHAEVRLEGAQAVVEDLGSSAGTRLNGLPLHAAHALAEGDVLRLGDTTLLYTSLGRAAVDAIPRSAAQLDLTGRTASIEAVRHSVGAVAPHPRTVVVTGETGTGKEIVSRLLHQQSGRAGPFVAVNCGGFTEGLLASELFGHVRGAFTGAVAEQQGLFRAARGGTLLLDEVSDMPLGLQATLLRVLETWEVRPVGSSRDVAVDVRVVAATNRELQGMVQRGLFRADLYARLAQWVIRLPPLRDRREDIPALTQALLSRLGQAGRPLSPDLAEALLLHPWPLNVRGLANVLSTAVIATPPGEPLDLGPEVLDALDDGRIEPVTAALAPPAPAVELDPEHLEALLVRFGGRLAELARHAGISRPKLYRLIWAAGLDPDQFRRPRRAAAPSAEPGRLLDA